MRSEFLLLHESIQGSNGTILYFLLEPLSRFESSSITRCYEPARPAISLDTGFCTQSYFGVVFAK